MGKLRHKEDTCWSFKNDPELKVAVMLDDKEENGDPSKNSGASWSKWLIR